MANGIFTLDDGTRELVINNIFGEEICKIHVRTGDISIVDRYNTLLNDFDKIIAPLQNVQMKSDGTSSFEDDWAVIKDVERELIGKLNSIFDTNDINKLFETRNAFSTIGGVFYVEKVIESEQDIFTVKVRLYSVILCIIVKNRCHLVTA